MLGKKQILKALAEKEIVIEPFDESLLEAASYGIRLGTELRIVKAGAVIDLRNEEFVFEIVKLEEQGYHLQPGEFVLGSTMETVTLGKRMGAWLDGRMKLARYGVSVHQASSFCDPDRSNVFTLEIFNAGKNSVALYPGLRVGALVFDWVTE